MGKDGRMEGRDWRDRIGMTEKEPRGYTCMYIQLGLEFEDVADPNSGLPNTWYVLGSFIVVNYMYPNDFQNYHASPTWKVR